MTMINARSVQAFVASATNSIARASSSAAAPSQRNNYRYHTSSSSSSSLSSSPSSSSLGCNDNNNENDKSNPKSTASTPTSKPTPTATPTYWERLGEPKHIMAPMVAQSDLAFRILCRRYGTDLCYTQMIHSRNFGRSIDFQNNHLDVYRNNERVFLSPSGTNILQGLDWSTPTPTHDHTIQRATHTTSELER